ncbi:MAG: DUF1287 domain-containing protein [Alphaproteobacteria bacterium]|nr:DUF1287 domain-containing protein [Alphaproteobacteria bacterium]
MMCCPPAGAALDEEQGAFARDLVAAAHAQRAVPVIYDPAYRKLEYPMGDVPWYIGVCTDVVVRAYRALGIDLQQLIHESRLGSGDRNIDHRRVVVMKKFFQRYGTKLPVSDKPEDYRPGDLVAYHLPDGTFSKSHIAIVSDSKTLEGVPLVIHNRGYGVREEDWLFGSEITGHYRYQRAPNISGWKK